jgi:hypothetical protein
MKRAKPLRSSLPGSFGKMTRAELDRESSRYDAEFSGVAAKRIEPSRPHPKKRGRPSKPVGEKAARVLITMEPHLLAAADAAAGKKGLTRAALISEAVGDWLQLSRGKRKTA